MASFTPGPWRVGWEDSEPYISPNICRNVSRFNKAQGEPEANARLIAAAPELLKAAKELDNATRTDGLTYEPKLRLRAAIARAEGGQ